MPTMVHDRPGDSVKQLAGASWLGTGLLGFACLAAAYKWEQEIQLICTGDNCVEDRRSWIEAHPVASAALVLFACSSLVLLIVHLVQRRRT